MAYPAAIRGAVGRNVMTGHMQNLQRAIEGHQLVEPQRMYDPGLIHPYQGQAPAGPTALADVVLLNRLLPKYNQGTCPEIVATMQGDAAAHGLKSQGLMLAGLGLAAVAGLAAYFAPASYGAARWAPPLLGTVICGVQAFSEGKKSDTLNHAAKLVEGWQTNIRNPNGLFPISEHECVNAEFMMYVERQEIGASRRLRCP